MVFSTNKAGTIGYLHTKKVNLDAGFIRFTNVNSKWIIDLRGKCKTIKFLGNNIKETINDHRNDNEYLIQNQWQWVFYTKPKTWSMK